MFLLPLLHYQVMAQEIYRHWFVAHVAWDSEEVDYFELILVRDKTNEEFKFTTTEKQFIVTKPKSGVYLVKVRGCVHDTINGQDICSEWHTSVDNNAKLKDGSYGAWKLFFVPSAPLILGIE